MNLSKIDKIKRDVIPLYETPFVYGQIEKEIASKLSNRNMGRVTAYLQKKREKCNTEIQGFLDESGVVEKHIVDNAIRLKNALHLKDLADKSSMEVKPILYYYSAEQFMNFFVYSLAKVPSPKPHHGVSVKVVETVEDTEITVKSSGFFARLVDIYSILGYESIFSPVNVRYDSGSSNPSFNLDNTSFSLIEDRRFTLKCLIDPNIRIDHISSDLLNLILLYVASHFARYSPHLWKQIVEGITSSYKIDFERAFSEYSFVIVKHIDFLDSLRHDLISSLNEPSDSTDHDVYSSFL